MRFRHLRKRKQNHEPSKTKTKIDVYVHVVYYLIKIGDSGGITKQYQDQIQKWWPLEKRFHRAIESRMWLEAVSLAYILLELRLRLLLRSTQGKTKTPLSRKEIDAQKYLLGLVDLAERNHFVDSALANRIRDFNQKRRDAIHGLIQGRIDYEDIESAARIYSGLTLPLQEAMGIKITLGPEETYEEYLEKRRARGDQ